MNGNSVSVDYRRSESEGFPTRAAVFDVQSVHPLVSIEHKYFQTSRAAEAYAECVRSGNRHLDVTVRSL